MLDRLARIAAIIISITLACPVYTQDASSPAEPPAKKTHAADAPADDGMGEDVEAEPPGPVILDSGLDLELFQAVVDGEEDEKLSKTFSRIKKKGAEEMEAFKQKVLQSESAQHAWRDALRGKFGITSEAIAKECPSLDEVKAQIAAEHTKLLQKKYPPSLMSKLEAQALMRYPTVKVGDTVTVRLRSGRRVTGMIHRMGASDALIGSTTIPLQDLDPRFYVEKAKMNRRAYVRKNYFDKRKAYETMLREKLPDYLHKRNGYVMYHGQWTTAKDLAQMIDDRIAYLAKRGEEVKIERQEKIEKIKSRAIQIGIGVAVLAVFILIIAILAHKKKK